MFKIRFRVAGDDESEPVVVSTTTPEAVFVVTAVALHSTNSRLKQWFASGLKWNNVGSARPANGNEFANDELASALQSKTIFTQEDWDVFGIKDLHMDNFIKSGVSYFQPAALYKRLHVPGMVSDRTVPIIVDDKLVNPDVGSGAVMVAPAHSDAGFPSLFSLFRRLRHLFGADAECGLRHSLDSISILDGACILGSARFTAVCACGSATCVCCMCMKRAAGMLRRSAAACASTRG